MGCNQPQIHVGLREKVAYSNRRLPKKRTIMTPLDCLSRCLASQLNIPVVMSSCPILSHLRLPQPPGLAWLSLKECCLTMSEDLGPGEVSSCKLGTGSLAKPLEHCWIPPLVPNKRRATSGNSRPIQQGSSNGARGPQMSLWRSGQD